MTKMQKLLQNYCVNMTMHIPFSGHEAVTDILTRNNADINVWHLYGPYLRSFLPWLVPPAVACCIKLLLFM